MALWNPGSITGINEGTVANDGTGDSIRAAFQTVESNFSNISLFLNNSIESTVDFGNANIGELQTTSISTVNLFSANTLGTDAVFTGNITANRINANLSIYNAGVTTLTGNSTIGNVIVIGQPEFAGANVKVSTNFTPTANIQYDLGSPTNFFRNLYVKGLVQVNTVALEADASILQLQPNLQIGVNKDVGIQGQYNINSSNTFAYFGLQYATKDFIYYNTPVNAAAGNSLVVGGVYGNVHFGSAFLSNTTPSANVSTGALIVSGGAGIGGNLNVGGNVNVPTTYGNLVGTYANLSYINTNWPNGVLQSNALTINGNVHANVIFSQGYQVLTTNTPGLTYYTNTPVFTTPIVVTANNPSTSANTGALVLSYGGIGAAGNIYTSSNVVASTGLVGPLYGTVMTAAQPNITSLGTLPVLNAGAINATSLGVSTITVGSSVNFSTGAIINGLGLLNISGNLTAGNVITTKGEFNNIQSTLTNSTNITSANIVVNAITATGTANVSNLYVSGTLVQAVSNDYQLTSNSSVTLPTQQAVKGYVDTITGSMFEPTGFSRSDPGSLGIYEFSLDGVTVYSVNQLSVQTTRTDGKFATGTAYETAATPRTFVVYPVPATGSFTIWQAGIRYQFTTLQKASFTASGPTSHYFFFDKGVLSSYNSISGDYIQKLPFVAEVYCDESTNTVVVLGEERHGITMDGATHLYLHTTTGTRYRTGFGITGITAGATNYTNTVGGQMWDEDILLALDNQTTNQMLYMSGTTWKLTPASNSFAYFVGGVAQYNQKVGVSYQLSDIPVGNYAVMYFTATNCRIHQMMKIMGQKVFTSLASARESAQTEPRDTSLLGLPSPEFIYVGAVIVDHNGQVQTLDNGAVFVDLRLINISGGINSTSAAIIAPASDSLYNNAGSGLIATNVQDALTELAVEKVDRAGDTMTGALAINNSSGLTTNQTSFNLVNTSASTLNLGGAATALNVGATTGTATINNPTVVGTQATQNLWNTNASTIYFGGAATELYVGNMNGVVTVAGITKSNGNIIAASGTASTNTTTGALVVKGGAGISGAVYAGSIQNTPVGSTTASTGAFTTLVNSGVHTSNGNLVAASGTASTSATTGALVVTGGAGITGTLNVAGNIVTSSTVVTPAIITPSAAATNITTSNLTVSNYSIQNISNDYQLTSNSSSVVPTQQAVKGYVDTITGSTFEPTGFNRADPTTMGIYEFSLDGITVYSVNQFGAVTTRTDSKFATGTAYQTPASPRTLAIYPVPATGSFTIWQAGIRYQFTTLQQVSFTAAGPTTHYFFFDRGVLNAYESITGDYIQKQPFIAEVYCDESTNTVVVLGEERHGITMDGATHLYLHTTTGTRYKKGLGISGISANATTYTATVGGEIWDEDILLVQENQTTNQMLYMSGTTWKITPATNSYAYFVNGVAQYNEKVGTSFKLSPIPAGNYAVMYFMATNCRIHQTMKIMGQKIFTSLASARESAQTEPRDTSLLGLPSPEFLYVGAVIVDNSGQVQILDNGATFVDLRLINISGGINSTSSAVVGPASDSLYNNVGSGLTATNVQDAITELAVEKVNRAGDIMTGALQMNTAAGITTNQTLFPLINTNATTVNFAGAATALNIGATTGTATINNPTVVGTQATQNLWNTTATTINAFGAATALNVGNSGGTTTIAGVTKHTGNLIAASGTASTSSTTGALVVVGGLGISGVLNAGSTIIGSGNIVAASGTASTSSTTGAIVTSGTGGLGVGGDIYNAGVHVSSGNIVAASGTASTSATTGALVVVGGTGISGTLNVGTNIVVNNTTALGAALGDTILHASLKGNNGNSNSLDFLMIRDTAGTDWTKSGTRIQQKVDATYMSYMQFNGGNSVSGIEWGTGGSTTGPLAVVADMRLDSAGSLRLLSGVTSTNTTTGTLIVTGGVGVSENLNVGGNEVLTGDLAVNGGDITTSATTFGLVDATATTVNFARAATTINAGAASGITNWAGVLKHSGNVVAASGTASTNTTTGALVVTGGIGVSGAVITGGNIVAASGTASSSTTTGALVVAGGAGISGQVTAGSVSTAGNVGANYVNSTTSFNGPGTGLTGSAASLSIGGSAPAGSLTGTTLASGVTSSSLTSVGTLTGLTLSGLIIGKTNSAGAVSVSNDTGSLSVRGDASNSATMSFHRVGAYAINMGLDTDNVFKIGGWSATANCFQLTGSGSLTLTGGITTSGTIAPSANNTYNLGTSSNWWSNVYGVAVQAKYADLAERYVSDNEYEPGTVVVFGGNEEITVTDQYGDTRVAGAISTNPAYLMNAAEPGLPVALRGRIPCKVEGPVTKGDGLITSTTPGYAISIGTNSGYGRAVFAKALETNLENGPKIITVVIL